MPEAGVVSRNGVKPGTPVSGIQARLINAGARQGHGLNKVPEVLLTDASNSLVRALQMGKLPAGVIGDAMILMVDGAMSPANRPTDLPEGALNIHAEDLGSRLVFARMLLEQSKDGWLIDRMVNVTEGIWRLFGRPMRRKVNRELISQDDSDEDKEFA